MKIETIIQNCRTNIVIGQPGEGKITEINRLSNPPLPRVTLNVLDITSDEFTPVNKDALQNKP